MKRFVQLVSSLGVTAVCLWWTFEDVDWSKMWLSLQRANYWWLIPYLGVLTLIHLCRTLRWGHLLAGLERVPFRKLNEASGIGFMLLILLPFRLGEFARPFLIAQRSGIRRSAAMTTVVLERIVDGLIIALLLRALMFFIPRDAPYYRELMLGGNAMFAIFGGGLVFLLFALWQRDRAVNLVRATAGRLSIRAGERVAEIVDGFVGAMKQLPGPANLVGFFVFTAGYWVANGLGMSLFSRAFDPAIHLTPFQGFFVLAVLVGGLMIPAAPGGTGTFQAAVVVALQVFIANTAMKEEMAAYANVLWLVQMAQQIAFGWVLAALSKQSLKDIFKKLDPEGGEGEGARAMAVAE